MVVLYGSGARSVSALVSFAAVPAPQSWLGSQCSVPSVQKGCMRNIRVFGWSGKYDLLWLSPDRDG